MLERPFSEVSQGELHRQVVARDSLVLVMARSHPWSARREIPVTDYATQSWVLRESGSGTRSEFEKVLIKAGLTLADLKVSLELPSNEAVLAAMRAEAHALSRRRTKLPATKSRSLAVRRPGAAFDVARPTRGLA